MLTCNVPKWYVFLFRMHGNCYRPLQMNLLWSKQQLTTHHPAVMWSSGHQSTRLVIITFYIPTMSWMKKKKEGHWFRIRGNEKANRQIIETKNKICTGFIHRWVKLKSQEEQKKIVNLKGIIFFLSWNKCYSL